MTNPTLRTLIAISATLAFSAAASARTDLVSNGGFEAGFSSWVRADQLASSGTFFDQTGITSPVNAIAVPSPPQGLHAAMSDADAPGGHALYQDIFIPAGTTGGSIQFSLYINNSATAFSTPASLDWTTPALNQQARVDLMSASADPFSTAAADIFQNLFQTAVGSPLVTGYNPFNIDISAALAAHAGQTLRLRFAETDNVNIFNFGVDAVSLDAVPAPPAMMLALPLMCFRPRTRR